MPNLNNQVRLTKKKHALPEDDSLQTLIESILELYPEVKDKSKKAEKLKQAITTVYKE